MDFEREKATKDEKSKPYNLAREKSRHTFVRQMQSTRSLLMTAELKVD